MVRFRTGRGPAENALIAGTGRFLLLKPAKQPVRAEACFKLDGKSTLCKSIAIYLISVSS